MGEWQNIFSRIEELVISGNHQNARNLFNEIGPRTVPREWACQLAQLASRIHFSIFALKVLHPFVSPENRFEKPPADSEIMTYSYALLNLGAYEEALDLLNTVDTKAVPEGLFLKALAHFRQWNYAQSIPLLTEFIQADDVDPYRRLVGEVNLVAAYIYTRNWSKAIAILDSVQKVCENEEYSLLLGNSFELRAQVLLFQGQFEPALECLEKAYQLLKDQSGLYLLFVNKWITICQCFMSPTKENFQLLNNLKSQALTHSEWETVRECDLFESIIFKNENLARKVVIGTPSEFYRQRARQLFNMPIKSLGIFELSLQNATPDDPCFDPYVKQSSQAALYEKPHLLAMFEALMLDFYKPAHMGAIFKSIYPTEKFNPFTSPARIMQLLKRLDAWFQENDVPLRVKFKKSEFELIATCPMRVLVNRGKKLSSIEGRLMELKNVVAGKSFTTAKISDALGISKTSAQRLVKEAIKKRKVVSVGQGRNINYQFSSNRKVKAAA